MSEVILREEFSAQILPGIMSESEDFYKTSGFAVHEGEFNSISVIYEELEKSANSLIGKPLILNHDKTDVCGIVGKITNAEFKMDVNAGKPGLFYEADIDPAEKKLIDKIEKGLISSVSVGFACQHICAICGKPVEECQHWTWDEGFGIIAKDISFRELSIVVSPADTDANIQVKFDDGSIFTEMEEKKRRTVIMSDFEKKYTEVVEEFSNYKMEQKEEIKKMEEEFKAKEEEYEMKISDKVEEVLSLKSDVEKLNGENEGLKGQVAEFEEKFAAIEEEKLSDLRKNVTELNKEVQAGLSEEEIEGLSEKALNRYIEMFSNIKENTASIKPIAPGNDQYNQKGEEFNDDPLAGLLNKVQ